MEESVNSETLNRQVPSHFRKTKKAKLRMKLNDHSRPIQATKFFFFTFCHYYKSNQSKITFD